MTKHIPTAVRAALVAALVTAAPAAQSQMYRWIDAQGSVTYSNRLPSDTSGLKDLTVVIDNPGSSPDKRGTEQPRSASPSASQSPPQVSAGSDARRPTVSDALDEFSRGRMSGTVSDATTGTAGGNAVGTVSSMPALAEPSQASTSPRISISPNAPEAVRDPCLRSADPKCIERNKSAYVPYRGYSPSTAMGATASAGASGTLAGGSPPPGPGRLTPPKASAYALPPGNEPLPASARSR